MCHRLLLSSSTSPYLTVTSTCPKHLPSLASLTKPPSTCIPPTLWLSVFSHILSPQPLLRLSSSCCFVAPSGHLLSFSKTRSSGKAFLGERHVPGSGSTDFLVPFDSRTTRIFFLVTLFYPKSYLSYSLPSSELRIPSFSTITCAVSQHGRLCASSSEIGQPGFSQQRVPQSEPA